MTQYFVYDNARMKQSDEQKYFDNINLLPSLMNLINLNSDGTRRQKGLSGSKKVNSA